MNDSQRLSHIVSANPAQDILLGWDEIEIYTRLTRKTLQSRGYPVRKEGRSVWAAKSALDDHREQTSGWLASETRERTASGGKVREVPGDAGSASKSPGVWIS